MMLLDMIEELGRSVVTEAGNVGNALPVARDAVIDIASLDINLRRSTSDQMAKIIAKRDIPFLYASGYVRVACRTSSRTERCCVNPFKEISSSAQSKPR